MYYRAANCLALLMLRFARASLDTDIEAILSRSAFRNASVGIEIRHLQTSETIYTRNAYLSLIPASNEKLITASTSLAILGSNFRFNTSVLATIETDSDGAINGDIYLQGSGDPSLSSSRLADLAREIAGAGVKKITGNVIGDGSRFDSQVLGTGWAWDDEPFSYSPQISGLNCDLNVVNVSVSPGQTAGEAATVMINGRSVGEEKYVLVKSTARTTSEGGTTDCSFDRLRGRNTITVSGAIPVGADPAEDQITVEDPAAYAAYRFALALRDAGIEVSTAPSDSGPAPASVVHLSTSTSQPLSELFKLFLKPSDNLYGEALFKTVGYTNSPSEPGSGDSAIRAIQSFLRTAGIGTDGVTTVDGSGLSRLNAVTATFLCDLLMNVYSFFNEADRNVLLDALPIGGVDGTLENRFRNTPVEGKVRAKTGSLTGVSSLSGYLTAENEEVYVFSILMNRAATAAEARKAQDDIVLALYESRIGRI